jgi:RNA polymerase sigma factor (sigma-70 family)
MAWTTRPDAEEPPTDDTQLIAASLAEPARFAELFDRHYPAILRYLRRRVGRHLADDLAAETFTLAFRRRHQYRAEHPDAAAWLYGIAGNLLRQHARAEERRLRAYARVVPDPTGPDIGDGVAERIDAAAAAGRDAVAVADLPAEEREVLLLLAWTELDYAGIARALGVPTGTVRSRLHRAHQRLRRQLGLADTEPPEPLQSAPPGRIDPA